ncbi:arylesterase [Actibacterium sp. 188UL27-1]|uniref:arylesterase n=1 Tax=Actibacterium sp. 188UL27-1 TaxID=2786961 RepID=UPI001EF4C002|nr:arylesterase [Actibacterium sp. 188UL27-1]
MILMTTAVTAQAETLTIAALGDSLTQGYGLPAEQGFVPQLQNWLVERGHDVVIINAGVSGDTTAGGLNRVEWTLADGVDGMILALGGNDLLRGIPPEASRSNLDNILKAATAQDIDVMLVGLPAPGNYGPDYKAAFDSMYPELAATYDALHFKDFLAGLSVLPNRATTLRKYMQSDGIHPNAEGVALIVDAMGPTVEQLLDRAAGS